MTHHNMGAFMSGTDWSQMNDRGKLSNYFLMLVVDTVTPGTRAAHNGWVAYVGFPSTIKQTVKSRIEKTDAKIEFANNLDGYMHLDFPIPETDKLVEKEEDKVKHVMCLMECTIVKEATDDRPVDPFLQRYHRVVAAVAEASRPTYVTPTPVQSPGARGNHTGTPNTTPGRPAPGNAGVLSKREQKRLKKTAERNSGKSIMAMTEKEWTAAQTEGNGKKTYIFNDTHVKALLNASVDYGFIDRSRWNDKDPIHAMIQFYQRSSTAVYQDYVDDFVQEMRIWTDANFEGSSDEEYLELVREVTKYIDSFSYHKWAETLLPELKDELAIATEICLEQYADEQTGKSPIVDQHEIPYASHSTEMGREYGGHMIGGPSNQRIYQDGWDDAERWTGMD